MGPTAPSPHPCQAFVGATEAEPRADPMLDTPTEWHLPEEAGPDPDLRAVGEKGWVSPQPLIPQGAKTLPSLSQNCSWPQVRWSRVALLLLPVLWGRGGGAVKPQAGGSPHRTNTSPAREGELHGRCPCQAVSSMLPVRFVHAPAESPSPVPGCCQQLGSSGKGLLSSG